MPISVKIKLVMDLMCILTLSFGLKEILLSKVIVQ